ncbi:hypothetical protein [uncultured Agathobaculum sp.]|uniref:hypothetical protein n=1 Tax=uncultured Agathobaculum sp. TaxID=2048140 RepID=UPI003209160A
MENIVKSNLRKSETILWQGAPEPFPLIEQGNRLSVLRLWAITVVFAAGMIAAYCTQNDAWEMRFVVGIVVIALLVISAPFIERARVQKQRFFLTNERAFLVMDSKKVYAMELSAIDEVQVVEDVANHACIAMGSCIFEYMRKEMRWRACHPKINMQDSEHRGQVDGMVFYDVADIKGAMEILEQRNCKKAA